MIARMCDPTDRETARMHDHTIKLNKFNLRFVQDHRALSSFAKIKGKFADVGRDGDNKTATFIAAE